ncbi:SelT/SelW/SelH family protein [Litorilinea aerophila]|uniref:SelT/SelW/SelH family protein n=1 Tax=Litorilinea aerophila TaxID=1204385 RepID=UPI001B877A8A|nr:SelT/SelW/SelH family protein [Litorilinea aerophila]MCC9075960.1 SelT/SelW/SelH family protein [Litorilinea aerophila]
MSVTRERFEQGMTYEAYKAQMTRNREQFEANEAAVTFDPDDLAFFAGLPHPLNVLVLAEDWCGDVIANLPVLGRLAQESGKLNLRIFLRDQNLDLMDQYLKDGQFRSIPTFVFFDADFNELGHWIERPARVTEQMAQLRQELFASDPALAGLDPDTPFGQLPEEARNRVRDAFARFRSENRDFANREVVREIRALLERGLPQARPTQQPQSVAQPRVPSRPARPTSNGAVKVSITYCAECGYQPQTLALTEALINSFMHELAEVELIPWQDGAFDVAIDGELVHSMARDGGFPEPEAIVQAVRERLAR